MDDITRPAVCMSCCAVCVGDLAQRMETTGLSVSIRTPIFREEKVPLTSTILAISHPHRLIGDDCTSCPRRDSGEGSPSLRYVF